MHAHTACEHVLVYLKSTFDLSALLFSSGSVKVPESKVLPSTHVVADLLGIPRYFACTIPIVICGKRGPRIKNGTDSERYRFKTVNAERKLLGQPRVPATKLILKRKGLPCGQATKLILRRKGLPRVLDTKLALTRKELPDEPSIGLTFPLMHRPCGRRPS